MSNRPCWALASVAVLTVLPLTATAGSAPPRPTIDIQILSVSDWHGQVDPLVVGTTQIGGAAVLSAYFQAERAANPNTLTLTGGDAVGATPVISSFFADEPAILAMNLMGFQADTLGNHNFDHGLARLQSQIDLAQFQYVSANLANRDANLTGVKDFEIFDVGGVKVGVIGITNPDAPDLVTPGSMGTMVPTDPVQVALKARNKAKDAGADIIVVIVHMGVTGFDQAGDPVGPLVDFARAVNRDDKKNPKIHVILGDHTDVQYSGIIHGALVYENRSRGLTYARAVLTVDAANRKIVDRSVTFVTPYASAVTPDPAIAQLLAGYRAQLAPLLNTLLGASTVFVPRSDSCGRADGRLCESLVGNVTADSMRERYAVDVAITNSGGLRASLTCPTTDNPTDFCPPYSPPPYPITRGQVLSVLPFANIAVTLTVTGDELKAMLENGVSLMPAANGRFPQVSGLCFTYDIALPLWSRVTGAVRQAADGSCTGPALDLTAATSYTLAENDFMAAGGDGYPAFGARGTTRDMMDQVLADHIAANSPLNPLIQGRITCVDSNGHAVAPNCPAFVP